MTPDDLEAITAQAYVEMLESGFTRVGEFHYVHHDPAGKPYANVAELAARVAAAAQTRYRSHVAARVLRARRVRRQAAERGATPLRDRRRWLRVFAGGQRARRRAVGRRHHRHGAAQPARRYARAIARSMALAPAGPIHIHAAEQIREVEDCVAWSGARPVQWLLDHAHGR